MKFPPQYNWNGEDQPSPEPIIVDSIVEAFELVNPTIEKPQEIDIVTGVPIVESIYFDNDTALKLYYSALQNESGLQSLIDRVQSALSIWTTPDGQLFYSGIVKQDATQAAQQINQSLRQTYMQITNQDISFDWLQLSSKAGNIPLEVYSWAIAQIEFIQWEAVTKVQSGDAAAGRYAKAGRQLLEGILNSLNFLARTTTTLTPGTPGAGDEIVVPTPPPTPPATTNSNTKILLIGAGVVALLYFLSKRK